MSTLTIADLASLDTKAVDILLSKGIHTTQTGRFYSWDSEDIGEFVHKLPGREPGEHVIKQHGKTLARADDLKMPCGIAMATDDKHKRWWVYHEQRNYDFEPVVGEDGRILGQFAHPTASTFRLWFADGKMKKYGDLSEADFYFKFTVVVKQEVEG